MSDRLLMLEEEAALFGGIPGGVDKLLRTDDDVRAAYRKSGPGVWVSFDATRLARLFGTSPPHRKGHRLLVCSALIPVRRCLFETRFERVVARDKGMSLLPTSDLIEVLSSEDRQDLLIGGAVDADAHTVVVLRGNLDAVFVPFSWFTSRPGGPTPDFRDFEVIDGGQTIRLGEYQAAVDALLYEKDAGFRRRLRERELERDDSFGGALKRLRLLRGLKRADFDGITAKEIARIERGAVKKLHGKTLQLLARKLGVSPGEIETY